MSPPFVDFATMVGSEGAVAEGAAMLALLVVDAACHFVGGDLRGVDVGAGFPGVVDACEASPTDTVLP